jgi:hypothetical protein
VTSDARIREPKPTIEQARDAGTSVLVMSHLEQPQQELYYDEISNAPVANRLEELVGLNVRREKVWGGGVRALLDRIDDGYMRAYYDGILCERRAKVSLARHEPGAGHVAYEWFRRAMHQYEAAHAIRPAGNDDTILRWNTCARILNRNPSVVAGTDEVSNHMLE